MNLTTNRVAAILDKSICPNCNSHGEIELVVDNKAFSREKVKYYTCMICDAGYEKVEHKRRVIA